MPTYFRAMRRCSPEKKVVYLSFLPSLSLLAPAERQVGEVTVPSKLCRAALEKVGATFGWLVMGIWPK